MRQWVLVAYWDSICARYNPTTFSFFFFFPLSFPIQILLSPFFPPNPTSYVPSLLSSFLSSAPTPPPLPPLLPLPIFFLPPSQPSSPWIRALWSCEPPIWPP
ncbi:hypothetical protein GLYMA_04G001150v4 [Glycine max]|nr:hypothetical protein GLYMA_04G001150v4 [Glycine max]KAH1109089.1 hypothetical protein GYH30_008471 [Glycine max]